MVTGFPLLRSSKLAREPGVSQPFIPAHFSSCIFKFHLPVQAFIRWVFGVVGGFAFCGLGWVF